MRRNVKLRNILSALVILLLSLVMGVCALAADISYTPDEPSNTTTDSNGASIVYRGRGLRKDLEDYGYTSLRFGYIINLPENAKLDSWYWNYTTNGKSFSSGSAKRLNGENRIDNGDNSYNTSLVIQNITSDYFRRTFYAQMTVKYTLDGEIYTIKDSVIRKTTVESVSDKILGTSNASANDNEYAQGIDTEIDTFETIISDRMYKTLKKAVEEGKNKSVIYVYRPVTVKEQINVKNNRTMTVTNIEDQQVTIGRTLDNQYMFQISEGSSLTFKCTGENTISLDGNGDTIEAYYPMINNAGTFTLGENVELKNGNANRPGGALTNTGTANLSGNVTGNITRISTNGSGTNGGAINNSGTLNILKGTYIGNTAAGSGGVIYSTGTVNIEDGTFKGNSADVQGGVICCYDNEKDGTVTVKNGTFTGNSAHSGGVFMVKGTLTISDGTFTENTANVEGADSGTGGVVYSIGTLKITGGTYTNNTSRRGGTAINIHEGTGTISNVKIYDNNVTDSYNGGGGINVSNSATLNLMDSDIHDNAVYYAGQENPGSDISLGKKSTLNLYDNISVGIVNQRYSYYGELEDELGEVHFVTINIMEKLTSQVILVPYNNTIFYEGDVTANKPEYVEIQVTEPPVIKFDGTYTTWDEDTMQATLDQIKVMFKTSETGLQDSGHAIGMNGFYYQIPVTENPDPEGSQGTEN